MRKAALLLAIALLSAPLAACFPLQRGDGLPDAQVEAGRPEEDDGTEAGKASPEDASEGETAESGSAEPSLIYVDGWPENEFTSEAPVPHFGTEPYEVVIDERYGEVTARWEGVSVDEARGYLEEVKAAGFTVDAIELGDGTVFDYFAYNNEDIDEASVVEINYYYSGEIVIMVANIKAPYEMR